MKGGATFVVVDPTAAVKRPLFDHQRLAAALSSAAHASYTATTLPFTTLSYKKDPEAMEFGVPRWRCTLDDYVCTHVAGSQSDDAGARGGRQGRGALPLASVTSPDGRLEAHIDKFNIAVGRVGESASAVAVTTDGREQDAYTMASLAWSPDSHKLAVYRRTPGYQRTLTLVQSSPPDQLQPKVITRNYRKPGDDVDYDQPVLVDVAARRGVAIDTALFPNAVRDLAAGVARGRPRVHVRVQPARTSGVSRHRGRSRATGAAARAHR